MNNKGGRKKDSAFHWIMKFAGTKKKYYIASVAAAFVERICALAPFFVMGLIVKHLLDGDRQMNTYMTLCLVMLAFWLGKVLLHTASTCLSHYATFQVLANLRREALAKLARMPLGDVLEKPSGTLKSIIVERIDSIETSLAHVVPEFTSNIAAPFFIFVYLLTVDWRMALVSLVTLPVALICFLRMTKDQDIWGRNAMEKTRALNDTAVEYINGIEVIKVFGKADSSYEKFITAAREGADCFIEWMRNTIMPFSAAMAIGPATLVAVLPIGGAFVIGGSLDAETFIQIIILSMGLLAPFITAMSYMDDMTKAGVIIGEVTGIINAPELERPERSLESSDKKDIVLRDVRFAYDEKEVLHGIDLDIEAGKMTALVGPSGGGKSTIARLISNLWDVTSGSITIGGTDIRDYSLTDHSDMVAYVSQDNYLFNDTVRENIRRGKKGATDEDVENAAKRSGCHEFIMSLENGYDTAVGHAGGHLSGGERQRIAIARAMLKDAPVVIFDEATAYTDPESEAVIQSSVAGLVRGKTLLVIAHRLSTIKDADKIVVIKDGTVDDQGTHEDLLSRGGLYRRMWDSHMAIRDSWEAEPAGEKAEASGDIRKSRRAADPAATEKEVQEA